MKKFIILCLGLVFLTSCKKEDIVPVSIQQISVAPVVVFDPFAALPKETAIPDSNFEKVLIDMNIDKILDGKVATANICYLTELLVIEPKGIQSIKGIESFISLTKIRMEKQQLKEVDITKNINLDFLSFWDNRSLSKLDVSQNKKLSILVLSNVDMETIDLSNNIALKHAEFGNIDYSEYGKTKGIKQIDFSKNVNLERVYFANNRLKELDLSKNPKITDVWYRDNPELTALKLAGTTTLKLVFGENNPNLEFLDLKGSYPQSVRVTNNPKLKSIRVTSLSWLEAHIKYWGDVWSKDSHTTYIQ
jgi:hypothetical protein